MAFVVARTTGGRPSLQHQTDDHEMTACGRDIRMWSRAYMKTPIKEILCIRCAKVIETKKTRGNRGRDES